MDKLIKKEVIKLYISQSLFLLISIFCACVPLFYDSVSLTGYKTLAGLFIFAAIIIFEIIFLTTWFYGLHVKLPAKLCLEAMIPTLYEIDDNFNKGLFSEEETRKCKDRSRYRNYTKQDVKWLIHTEGEENQGEKHRTDNFAENRTIDAWVLKDC